MAYSKTPKIYYIFSHLSLRDLREKYRDCAAYGEAAADSADQRVNRLFGCELGEDGGGVGVGVGGVDDEVMNCVAANHHIGDAAASDGIVSSR